MDWHGCPDPSAYCPPDHCSDPVAHHRIQARKRVEAAFAGSAGRQLPPSLDFRGLAEEKVTARTLFSEEGTSARPQFDPAPFLKPSNNAEDASNNAEDAVLAAASVPQQPAKPRVHVRRAESKPELVLPRIPAKLSSMSVVPFLQLGQLGTLANNKQAKFLSARNASSAFQSSTQRGAVTARVAATGWQPLRNRPKREEQVDPEQLLKVLCPDMYQDLKVLLDKDFVQKVSLVRRQSDIEGDVQQRLRAMVAVDGARESTGAVGNGNQPAEGLEGAPSMSTVLGGSRMGSTCQRGDESAGECPRKTQSYRAAAPTGHPQKKHAERSGATHKEAAVCRPMLPQFYLENVENESSCSKQECRLREAEGVVNGGTQNRAESPLGELPQAKGSSAQSQVRPSCNEEDSLRNSGVATRRRCSTSNKKSSQAGVTPSVKKALALEIDNTLKKKMERLTAELEGYKQKVKDLEVQLSVTSPRQTEEKMLSLEARLQEQIWAMEQQYRTKVENIRAAHRTELADWKASEVDNLRRAMQRACEAKLRLVGEEREALERRLAEMQQQVSAAAESASHERALRVPMEDEIARLRRLCKGNEGRSRALEKELVELHGKAGDAKGVAKSLTERAAAQPAFARHLSLLSDLPGSPRQSLGISESIDGAFTEASHGTLGEKALSRSYSSLSPIPDASPTERSPTGIALSRLASSLDASHLAGGALRSMRSSTESGWAAAIAHTAHARTGIGRRVTVASEEDMDLATSSSVELLPGDHPAEGPLEGRDSPAAKRALLTISPPSLHMSIDVSGLISPSDAGASGSAESLLTKAALGRSAAVPTPKPIVFPARSPQEKNEARVKMRSTVR